MYYSLSFELDGNIIVAVELLQHTHHFLDHLERVHNHKHLYANAAARVI